MEREEGLYVVRLSRVLNLYVTKMNKEIDQLVFPLLINSAARQSLGLSV